MFDTSWRYKKKTHNSWVQADIVLNNLFQEDDNFFNKFYLFLKCSCHLLLYTKCLILKLAVIFFIVNVMSFFIFPLYTDLKCVVVPLDILAQAKQMFCLNYLIDVYHLFGYFKQFEDSYTHFFLLSSGFLR